MGTAFEWAQVAAGFVAIMSGVWVCNGWKRPSWGPRYRRYMGGGNVLVGAGVLVQGTDQMLNHQVAWMEWLSGVLFLTGGVSMFYWGLRDSWEGL